MARGDALLAPRVTRRLVSEFARQRHKASQPSFSTDLLTAREMEVLGFIARASSNGEIAQALYVSENTVKSHVTHLLGKLGLRDRVQAVIYSPMRTAS